MTTRSSAAAPAPAAPLTLCVVKSKPSWSSLASLLVAFALATLAVSSSVVPVAAGGSWTTTRSLGVMTPLKNANFETNGANRDVSSSPMDAYHTEQHAQFGVRPQSNRRNSRHRRLRAISEPNSSPMDAFHLTFESLPHQHHDNRGHFASDSGNTLVRRAIQAVETTKMAVSAATTTTFVTATTARSKDTEKEDSATTTKSSSTRSTPTRLTLAQRQRRWRSFISTSSAPPAAVADDAFTTGTLSPMDAFDVGASQRPTILSPNNRDSFDSTDASSMMQYHALRHRRLTQVENETSNASTTSQESSSKSSQWLLSIHEWAVTTSLTTRIVVLVCAALALIGMGITICCCVCDIAACYASCQRRRQRRQTSSKSKAGATSTEGDQTDTEDYGVDLSFDEEDDDDLDYTECGFASQDALPPGVDLNLYHRTSRSNNIHSNGDNVPMVVVPNSRSRRGILRTSKKPWRTASTSPPSVSSSVDATVGRGRRPDKGSSIATEDATVTSVASSSSSSASSSPFIVFSSAHSDDSGSVRADDDEGVVVMAAVDNEDAETNAPTQKRRGGGSGMVAPPPTSHCSERVQREAWDEFERQSSSCPLRQNNAQYINGDDYDDEAVLVHEYRLPLSVQWKRQMSALNLTPGIVQSTGLGDDDHEMDGNDCGSNDGAKITVTERELVEI